MKDKSNRRRNIARRRRCKKYFRPQFEMLEPRLVLASIQVLSYPKASHSGHARATANLQQQVTDGAQSVGWSATGFASSERVSDDIVSGSFNYSGPFTFRIVPDAPDEIGERQTLDLSTDYYYDWDLDPLKRGGTFGVDQGGENKAFGSMSMSPIGKLFQFEVGEPVSPYKGLWWTAGSFGGPDEFDSRFLAVEVGQTYTINIQGGGFSHGLWVGGTDWHGEVYTSMSLGLDLYGTEPEVGVSQIEAARDGTIRVTYHGVNLESDSEVKLYWGRRSDTTGDVHPLGGSIYTIPVDKDLGGQDIEMLTINDLRQNPPRNATHLLAIADPANNVKEVDETNNREHSEILAELELEIDFHGPTRTANDGGALCASCQFDAVDKREVFRLVAEVTNHGVYPWLVSFDVHENFANDPVPNISPPLRNGQDALRDIEPIRVGPGQTMPVILDRISKTWDWLPDENPFAEDFSLMDAAGFAAKAREVKVEQLKDRFSLKGQSDGPLDTLLSHAEFAYAFTTPEPIVDLNYFVELARPEALPTAVTDSAKLRFEVPDHFKSKFVQAALSGYLAGIAKAQTMALGIAGLVSGGAAWVGAAAFGASYLTLNHMSNRAYEQAKDPPDPNFDAFVSVQYSPIEAADQGHGLPSVFAQRTSDRNALAAAEAASRDKALGAQEVGDWRWFAAQLDSAAGFAAAGMSLDARQVVAEHLFHPARDVLIDDPAAVEDAISPAFPSELETILTDRMGMSAAEIETVRREIVDEGADQVFASLSDGTASTVLAGMAAINATQELLQAIHIRVNHLDAVRYPLDFDELGRLSDLRDDVRAAMENPPSKTQLELIEQYRTASRDALTKTNDPENESYLNDIAAANDYLIQFMNQDFSLEAFEAILDADASAIDDSLETDLRSRLADLRTELASSDFAAAEIELSGLLAAAEAGRASGQFSSPYFSDRTIGFLELLHEASSGGNLSPALIRPPATLASYQGAAPVEVNLSEVLADLDSNAPLTFSLLNNSDPAIATPSLNGDLLTITPAAVADGTTRVSVRASDGNRTIETAIEVTLHGAVPETQATPISDQAVSENSLLTLQAEAAVKDQFGQWDYSPFNFDFSVRGLHGATIDEIGVLRWFAGEETGGGSFDVEIDATLNNSDLPVTLTIPFRVDVADSLSAPVLSQISQAPIELGTPWEFTAEVIDYDVPVEAISFSLSNAPTGATVDANGHFSWTPDATGQYSFLLIAQDASGLSDELPIDVTVYQGAPPTLDIDLAPEVLQAGEYLGSWGDTLSITSITTNYGADRSPQFEIGFYLSDSPTGGPNDVMLQLADGASVRHHDALGSGDLGPPIQTELTMPDAPPAAWTGAEVWILAKLDPLAKIVESDESNNFASGGEGVDATPIVLADVLPDLRGKEAFLPAGKARWGDLVSMETRVGNFGSSSGPYRVEWFLSRSPEGGLDDIRLPLQDGSTGVDFAGLPAGADRKTDAVLQLPQRKPTGWDLDEYFIIPQIDVGNAVHESDETNNRGETGLGLGAAPIAFEAADLLGFVSANLTVSNWGDVIAFDTFLQNDGALNAGPFDVAWHISTNSDGTGAVPLPLANGDPVYRMEGLESGAYRDLSMEFMLPETPIAGSDGKQIWLHAQVDSADEVNEIWDDNNFSRGVDAYAISVVEEGDLRPDLRGGGVSLSSPLWGAAASVDFSLHNYGLSPTDDFEVRWFLSNDFQFGPEDIPLQLTSGADGFGAAGLAADEDVYGLNVQLQMPTYVPFDWVGNDGFLFQFVDSAEQVSEIHEWNNEYRSTEFTIRESLPDLDMGTPIIESPTESIDRADLPTAAWGEAFQVIGNVNNDGVGNTGPFHLRWYISRDVTLSEDDTLVPLSVGAESYEHLGLATGVQFNYDVTLQLPNSGPDSDSSPMFYLLASADAENEVDESREFNNVEMAGMYITPPPQPNLRGFSQRVDYWDDVLRWSSEFDVDAEIQNNGNWTAFNDFDVQWFISKDQQLGPDDTLLLDTDGEESQRVTRDIDGTRWFGDFISLAFTTASVSATLQLPAKPADWGDEPVWLLMQVDVLNEVDESNEADNAVALGEGFDSLVLPIEDVTAHNFDDPFDVNADTFFRIDDVFIVIDAVRTGPLGAQPDPGPPFVDVDNDTRLTLIDGFTIVAEIRAVFGGFGEGESSSFISIAPPDALAASAFGGSPQRVSNSVRETERTISSKPKWTFTRSRMAGGSRPSDSGLAPQQRDVVDAFWTQFDDPTRAGDEGFAWDSTLPEDLARAVNQIWRRERRR